MIRRRAVGDPLDLESLTTVRHDGHAFRWCVSCLSLWRLRASGGCGRHVWHPTRYTRDPGDINESLFLRLSTSYVLGKRVRASRSTQLLATSNAPRASPFVWTRPSFPFDGWDAETTELLLACCPGPCSMRRMGFDAIAVPWQQGSWTRRRTLTIELVFLSVLIVMAIAGAASESTRTVVESSPPMQHHQSVDKSSVKGRREPASGGVPCQRRRMQQANESVESSALSDIVVPCGYECRQPCDFSCRVAHAVCTGGGTLEPVCALSNASQRPVENRLAASWTNPIDCTGGSILCDLMYAPSADASASSPCDGSLASVRPIGRVLLDTDSNFVQFGLTDSWLRISSVTVYVGNASNPALAGNDSKSVRSWYYPYVQQTAIQVDLPWRVATGTFLSAHASVCWGSTSTPAAAPSSVGSPVVAPTAPRSDGLPACPLQPVLPSISVQSADATSSGSRSPTVARRRTLEWDDVLCPNQCRPEHNQPCDSTCQNAWAYCNATELSSMPTCILRARNDQTLPGSTTASWANQLPCFGGTYECDLYVMPESGARDCEINAAAGDLRIGTVRIDTDANTCAFNVSASNYTISSARVSRITDMSAYMTSLDPFPLNSTKSTWFERGTKFVLLEQGKGHVSFAEEFFAAHAHVCRHFEESQPRALDSAPSANTCPLRLQAQPSPSPKLTFPSESTGVPSSASPLPADNRADDRPEGGAGASPPASEAPSPVGNNEAPMSPETGTPTEPRPSLPTPPTLDCPPVARPLLPTPRPTVLIPLPPFFFRRRKLLPPLCPPPSTFQPSSLLSTDAPTPTASKAPKSKTPEPSNFPSPRGTNGPSASSIPSLRPSLLPTSSLNPSRSEQPSSFITPSTRPSASPKPSRSRSPSLTTRPTEPRPRPSSSPDPSMPLNLSQPVTLRSPEVSEVLSLHPIHDPTSESHNIETSQPSSSMTLSTSKPSSRPSRLRSHSPTQPSHASSPVPRSGTDSPVQRSKKPISAGPMPSKDPTPTSGIQPTTTMGPTDPQSSPEPSF